MGKAKYQISNSEPDSTAQQTATQQPPKQSEVLDRFEVLQGPDGWLRINTWVRAPDATTLPDVLRSIANIVEDTNSSGRD